MAEIKKITLTEEELIKHAKIAIADKPPHNEITVEVVDHFDDINKDTGDDANRGTLSADKAMGADDDVNKN